MAIDLTPERRPAELRDRTAALVRTVTRPSGLDTLRWPGATEGIRRRTLQQAARCAGAHAPAVPAEPDAWRLTLEQAAPSLPGRFAPDCAVSAHPRETWPFRSCDGPSRTHCWSIARRALRDAATKEPNR